MRLIDLIHSLAITGPRPLTAAEQQFLAVLGDEWDAAASSVQLRHIAEREGLLEPWMFEAAAALLEDAFIVGAAMTIH